MNVVYIGPQSFPSGGATTKRRRYMVDYMNANGIPCHYLCCDFKQREKRCNDTKGLYGKCDYLDVTPIADGKHYISFWRTGKKQLKEWYKDNCKNILIFDTLLYWFDYPFYRYAKKMGYHVVFDQVETSYLQNGKVSFAHSLNIRLGEWLSDKAFKKSPAFVISQALQEENSNRYPNRKLCLLPNSTPVLNDIPKTKIGSPLLLLYSGTYAPKDGVSDLIDGVIEAHEKGCNCKLILLGKGNVEDMKVLQKAEGKAYIEYRGFVSDEELLQTMIKSDVLCMTRTNSRFANYGFPFKLSEYLATGNILLATSVGDVCQYVNDKKSAYIVAPESSTAIANAILHISNNHEEALQVAKNGFESMKEHFSIEIVGKKFVDFLSLI